MVIKSKFQVIISVISSVFIISITSPAMAGRPAFSTVLGGRPVQTNLHITAEVPSICYADMDVTGQKDNKVTMKMKRFCNAYHSIELSATIDDNPIEELSATIKGKEITEDDGTLTLYKHSPPEIGQEKIRLQIPPEYQDISEIVLSLTINPE